MERFTLLYFYMRKINVSHKILHWSFRWLLNAEDRLQWAFTVDISALCWDWRKTSPRLTYISSALPELATTPDLTSVNLEWTDHRTRLIMVWNIIISVLLLMPDNPAVCFQPTALVSPAQSAGKKAGTVARRLEALSRVRDINARHYTRPAYLACTVIQITVPPHTDMPIYTHATSDDNS